MFGIKTRLLNEISRRWHYWHVPLGVLRPLPLPEIQKMALSRTTQYIYCDFYFHHFLPREIKEHRFYFSQEHRGFGEDAFHAMWFILFEHFTPKKTLEIGVYRGQTITLWKLLSRYFKYDCQVACVSPFESAGDSVSKYTNNLDYYEDTRKNHEYFNLPLPDICRHFSTDPEAIQFILKDQWDLIYIDGNHDYEVASRDWEVCSKAVAKGGLIVLDDSALYTDYKPPRFATKGHPGPSQVADSIPKDQFVEIFHTGHNRVFQKI